MRFVPAALLSVGVLVSQISVAGTPASSLQQLGAVQAAIDFCTKIDSDDVKRLERAALAVLPDMTEARVAAARHSTEFQQAYQIIDSVLKGLATSDGVRLCAAAAREEPGEPNKDHDPKKDQRR
jgi:hypothetical protein